MARADAELTELARRYLAACMARDTDYIAAHSIDRSDCGFLGIGSMPGELWTLPKLTSHLRQFPPTQLARSALLGFTEGNVAWFTDHPDCILPSGVAVPVRISLVMLRSGKDWRAVHFHVSEGIVRML